MIKKISKLFDVPYFVRFIGIFVILYFFNLFYIGITSKGGGFYSPFLDHYLNYIVWFRNSILYTSNFIAHLFGLPSYVADLYTLKAYDLSVTMVYSCLGLGIMSFWIAFILADNTGWQKKLSWGITGIVFIWLINCFRVALLLLALKNNWQVNKYMDHHDLYNIVSYLLILLLIYFYYKKTKNNKKDSITN